MVLSVGSKSRALCPDHSFPLVFRDSPCSSRRELLNMWLCSPARFLSCCMTADVIGLVRFSYGPGNWNLIATKQHRRWQIQLSFIMSCYLSAEDCVQDETAAGGIFHLWCLWSHPNKVSFAGWFFDKGLHRNSLHHCCKDVHFTAPNISL